MSKKRKHHKYPLIIDQIRIPSLHQLNWHALQYAIYVAGRVDKEGRKGKIAKIEINSYPACAVCLQCSLCGNISYGESGQYILKDSAFLPPLRKMLKSLGSIGQKNKWGSCNYPIGKCAEPCAVNSFLHDCIKCKTKPCKRHAVLGRYYRKEIIDTKSYVLSEAFRPRTEEHIDRCVNCERLFGKNPNM